MLKTIFTGALLMVWGPLGHAAPVLNPANGHYYDLVAFPAQSWDEANIDAQAHTFLGLQGHLATITSKQEDDFLVATFGTSALGAHWLGGYQDTHSPDYVEPGGAWTWVTGEPWAYTHWFPGEPNDGGTGCCDIENWLQIRGDFPTTWNDITDTDPGIAGYVLEYDGGGLGGIVVNLKVRGVRCHNMTTGQVVQAKLDGRSWDCVALGLTVSPGDEVRMGVDGDAK